MTAFDPADRIPTVSMYRSLIEILKHLESNVKLMSTINESFVNHKKELMESIDLDYLYIIEEVNN